MATYGYGPPPPPPPPSQPSSGFGQYQPSYQHGPQHNRGGRGGAYNLGGRSGEYQAVSAYAYNSQATQAYGQQSHYNIASPQHGPYAPQHQQWAPDPAAQGHPQQQQAAHNSLPPSTYQASYTPQLYQQRQQGLASVHHQSPQGPFSYSQQPPYAPSTSSQQPYGQQQYQHPSQPSNGHTPQQWGPPSHGQHSVGHGGQYNGGGGGGGRGRGGGHHHERGGKAQMMGPPIRIGFENGSSLQGPSHVAPVSNSYQPPPPYRHAQSSPVPPHRPSGYASGPYQPYPPIGQAATAGVPSYDPYYNQNGRQYGRIGYQNVSYRGGRPNFGGDKMRHKKIGGGPVKTGSSQHHQKPDAASAGKKKKRKTNTLGLTPGEESEEEDVDEEAKLVEMIGPDAPNPTDIAAWIEQRRKNFPTRARAMARLDSSGEGDKASKPGGGVVNGEKRISNLTALERQQQKAEKLRKQLEKVESSIKRKREQQDEGDEMRGVDGESSDAPSDSKSDDEAPETMPIRGEAIPPAPKRADHSKHCKYYSTGGTCGKKGKCRFVHDPAVRQAALQERERNGGRMTLQQRLILNDKDQEDLTIVKTLQYLKEKGIMKDCVSELSAAHTSSNSIRPPAVESPQLQPMLQQPQEVGLEHGQQPHSLPAQPPSSLLPAPPAAPNFAPTVQYQGWNLSGFGNAGVKSSDL